jgi:PmbA protein
MTSENEQQLLELTTFVVEQARAQGADVAEGSAQSGWELSARIRLGELELLEEAGSKHVNLRVMRNGSVAGASTSDIRPEGLMRCVKNAMALLALTEPDPDSRPAEPSELCHPPFPELELFDPSLSGLSADRIVQFCRDAEHAALSSDPRLSHSEGASFSRVTGESALVLSTGFSGTRRGSYASLSVVPVAAEADGKRRRGHYATVARHFEDLEAPEAVGLEAARRTLAQLGARSLPTSHLPIVFSEDAAPSIIGTFASCLLGGALWRKSSYLVDRLGTDVASALVTMVDEPHLLRGFGSRRFDGEGLACSRRVVVEAGRYTQPLLDCTSARKLGLAATGSASRHGSTISASTSNFLLLPGTETVESLIQKTPRGLFVTDMMGFGFNPTTADFSRGASGFLIEDGRLTFPVSEVTISSNLDTMLKSIDAIGQTPRIRSSTIVPAFRIQEMTIAGNADATVK